MNISSVFVLDNKALILTLLKPEINSHLQFNKPFLSTSSTNKLF